MVEIFGIDFCVDYGFELVKLVDIDGRIEFIINGINFFKNDEVRDVSVFDEVIDVFGMFGWLEWIVNMSVDYIIGEFVVGWRGCYEGS